MLSYIWRTNLFNIVVYQTNQCLYFSYILLWVQFSCTRRDLIILFWKWRRQTCNYAWRQTHSKLWIMDIASVAKPGRTYCNCRLADHCLKGDETCRCRFWDGHGLITVELVETTYILMKINQMLLVCYNLNSLHYMVFYVATILKNRGKQRSGNFSFNNFF